MTPSVFQADTIIPGDIITVTLQGEDGTGKRVGFNYTFAHDGAQLDANLRPNGGRALDVAGVLKKSENQPVFPQADFEAAVEANDAQLQRDIVSIFYEAVTGFQAAGGDLAQDAMLDAVYNFMRAEHGLQPEDHEGFVLNKGDVTCRAPGRADEDAPGTWFVGMSPTWG